MSSPTRSDRLPEGAGQAAWRRWKFIVLVVGVAAGLGTVTVLGVPMPGPVLGGLADWGPVGAILATLSVAAAIVLMVPRTVVAVTAGALFGWLPATGYLLVGAVLGASLAFAVGRVLGRDYTTAKLLAWSQTSLPGSAWSVRAWFKQQLIAADAWLERDGVMGIWIIRMVPVTHYGVTSYAAGAAAIRYRHFLLGTTLATIPGAVGFTAVGGAVVDPQSIPLAGGVATAVGLFAVLAAWLVRRRFVRRPGGRAQDVGVAPLAQEG